MTIVAWPLDKCGMPFDRTSYGRSSGTPLVSIIIPAFNKAPFIREAIESALSQSYPRVELLVIDDGSTDETVEVLRSFGGSIRWLSQPNLGQSAAINRGVSLSTGELVGYLGADDRLKLSAIETTVDNLTRERSACLAYPDFDLIDLQGRKLRSVLAPSYDQRRLIAGFRCLPGPGAIARKEAWIRCGGWSARFVQIPDMDFYFRLSLVGSFLHVPQSLAEFRVHPGSTTHSASSYDKADEPLKLVSEFFARPELPNEIRAWESESYSNALLLSGFLHATGKRLPLATQCFIRAVRLNPKLLLSRELVSYLVRSLTIARPGRT